MLARGGINAQGYSSTTSLKEVPNTLVHFFDIIHLTCLAIPKGSELSCNQLDIYLCLKMLLKVQFLAT